MTTSKVLSCLHSFVYHVQSFHSRPVLPQFTSSFLTSVNPALSAVSVLQQVTSRPTKSRPVPSTRPSSPFPVLQSSRQCDIPHVRPVLPRSRRSGPSQVQSVPDYVQFPHQCYHFQSFIITPVFFTTSSPSVTRPNVLHAHCSQLLSSTARP